jgi:hypothetical protein
MSVKISGLVWDRYEFGGNKRMVALAIADHAHDDGTHIFPGIERLAVKTMLSVRTIQRVLAEMQSDGWLIKVGQYNRGRGIATEFKINEGWIKGDNLSPFLSDKRVTNDAQKGDKLSQKGDTAVSAQPSLTTNTITTTPRANEPLPESKQIRPEGALACRLIPLGVSVTSMHPTLCKWVADKIPLELIEQCLALARLQKPVPEKIAANYLDSIIRSELRPKKPDKSWVMSDEATLAHGNEIGLLPKVGESMADYKMRLKAA